MKLYRKILKASFSRFIRIFSRLVFILFYLIVKSILNLFDKIDLLFVDEKSLVKASLYKK